MLKVSIHAFERFSLRLKLDPIKNYKDIKNMIDRSYEVTVEVASKIVNIRYNNKKNRYYIAFDPIKNYPAIMIVRDKKIVTILTKDLDWIMPRVGI